MNRLGALWQLQQIDIEMVAKHQQFRLAQSQLGESQEFIAAREEVQKTGERLQQVQAHLRTSELELGGLDAKIQDAKGRLYGGRVSNPKELTALQKDVEYLSRRGDQLEDGVLQAMSKVEELQAAVQTARSRYEQIEADWSTGQEQLAVSSRDLMARLKELQAKRAELVAPISREDMLAYEEVRQRKSGQPLSILQGDHCVTCHVTLPIAKQHLVRRKTDLVHCEGCGRILYVPD